MMNAQRTVPIFMNRITTGKRLGMCQVGRAWIQDCNSQHYHCPITYILSLMCRQKLYIRASLGSGNSSEFLCFSEYFSILHAYSLGRTNLKCRHDIPTYSFSKGPSSRASRGDRRHQICGNFNCGELSTGKQYYTFLSYLLCIVNNSYQWKGPFFFVLLYTSCNNKIIIKLRIMAPQLSLFCSVIYTISFIAE